MVFLIFIFHSKWLVLGFYNFDLKTSVLHTWVHLISNSFKIIWIVWLLGVICGTLLFVLFKREFDVIFIRLFKGWTGKKKGFFRIFFLCFLIFSCVRKRSQSVVSNIVLEQIWLKNLEGRILKHCLLLYVNYNWLCSKLCTEMSTLNTCSVWCGIVKVPSFITFFSKLYVFKSLKRLVGIK